MRYIVRQGDTLRQIAGSMLGDAARWDELARLNGIGPPYTLVTGQSLQVPERDNAHLRGWTEGGSRAGAPVRLVAGSAAQPPREQGADALPARAFLFVLADEILPSGKLVRKVLEVPVSSAEYVAAHPELFGIKPGNPASTVSIGEHALGNTASRYTSASSLKGGAPNIAGRPVFIDIPKARAAGVVIHNTEEIVADLERLAAADPSLRARVNKLKEVIKSVEGEVLLEGNVPAGAVKSAGAMAVTRGLRAVQVVGVVLTVYDLGNATVKSVERRSASPLLAEGVRQAGGWGMAWAGMKLGCAGGAALGIETGPGAVLTCAGGGLLFGVLGYVGFDWLADKIDQN
ncbi:MAG: LysM peptidoglycan-binding domain-containing protein [Sterolibacteriaceae bacterium]|nr:LysM peptidoglycan-binding domain-containing protein [Candidatus Methylophosphatis haderslevensis]